MIATDVLIAGAGPAGTEAAYQLSEAGLRVVVIEKRKLNREKPCGGAIQTGELLEFGSPPDEIIERRISNARIFGPEKTRLKISTRHRDQFSITVKRSTYDSWLQKRAAKARFLERAEILDLLHADGRWRISAITREGPLHLDADIVIHAAGANASSLERLLGLDVPGLKGMGITCQYWLEAGSQALDEVFCDSIEFHFDPDRIPGGYFWLFPKQDILVTGAGTTLDEIRKKKISLRRELDNFLNDQLPRLGLSPETPRLRMDGGKVPMTLRKKLWGDGLLITGDAAGVVSTIHGGGIYQARKTGLFAAQAARAYLDGGKKALPEYQERLREYFYQQERRWDERLRPFLQDNHLIKLLLEKGRGDEKIREGLGIVLSSTETHRRAYELIEEASFELIAGELDEIVAPERQLVNRELEKLFTEDSYLHEMANEVLLKGGKRLRAILVLLVGQALGAATEDLLPVALAYEVSHTASLVHDDIIDGGEWRRGAETLHRKFGVGHAITAGDALLIKGFEMMVAYSERPGVDRDTIINLINVGCRSGLHASEGEVRDINFSPEEIAGKSVEDYIELIRLKTGALLEAATEAGAVLARTSADVAGSMREFGMYLGIAFQIYDDAKDLLAASTISLKSRFTDIKKGKLTAQLIHTVNAASAQDRERLLHLLSTGSSEGADEILELYRKYDALQFNQKISREYLDRACEKLESLPESQHKEKLAGILRVLGYWTRFSPGV
ncbi:geranylgeranyl reductase family protein [candidate division WOR-3 bacterium]|uniref:Geranylgeranyl reductase family protein n=1 Tax=candidate division WOR-3 bacterium TaxID=2052148 RepID=A0A9D5QD23_UNCW3|nr:geranylgeranyl reductase family protein [candidate division WOR-3 bacterium]MBD3364601.1 geranylgeranyl reductase family protein [candidate division WOR-3 bacterium]